MNNDKLIEAMALFVERVDNDTTRGLFGDEPFDEIRAALAAVVANATVEAGGWVSVEERLPTAGEKVLAYNTELNKVDAFALVRYSPELEGEGGAKWQGKWLHAARNWFTHWRPLEVPAAPQPEVKPSGTTVPLSKKEKE